MISLRFEPNGTFHCDIRFQLAGSEHFSDSYLWVAPHLSETAVINRLVSALDIWVEKTKSSTVGKVLSLPIDLSDQCTKWLRCEFARESVELQTGWSSDEGYWVAQNMHLFIDKNIDLSRPEPIPPVIIERSAMVDALAFSRAEMASLMP